MNCCVIAKYTQYAHAYRRNGRKPQSSHSDKVSHKTKVEFLAWVPSNSSSYGQHFMLLVTTFSFSILQDICNRPKQRTERGDAIKIDIYAFGFVNNPCVHSNVNKENG